MADAYTCPSCGDTYEASDVFCPHCGTRVKGEGRTRVAPSAPPVAPPPPAPPPPQPAAPAMPPPAPPPAAPAVRKTPYTFDLRFGRLDLVFKPLAIAGGIAVIVAASLAWLDLGVRSPSAYDIPVQFLFDRKDLGATGFKLGVFLLLLGIAGAALSLVPGLAQLRRLVGAAILAAAVAYCVQVGLLVHDGAGSVGDFFDALGAGVYVAAAGGFVVSTAT